MEHNENFKKIEKEYAENYKIIHYPMKVAGFSRFEIKDKAIVELSRNTLAYRIILLMIADLGAGFLMYTSIISKNYLELPDGMCLVHFTYFVNMLLLNLTFVNRNSGLILFRQSFRIDSHLGLDETKFMRDFELKTFIGLRVLIAFSNLTNGIFLYRMYDVSTSLHIIGTLYFIWLFFCYDDYCFFLLWGTFIAIRARYLNVALAKIGGLNIEYLSDRALLNLFFWKKPYDNLVTFQCRSSPEDFIMAFEMIFEMIRHMEMFYKFPLGLAIWTVVSGTFVTCQTFIEQIRNPDQELGQERALLVLGGAVLSWAFSLLSCVFMDMFEQQIEQTKLICACIQLKPNRPALIYNQTKTLLRLLERRSSRISIYNLFTYDIGFMLRLAAATLVYITVQLQLAF